MSTTTTEAYVARPGNKISLEKVQYPRLDSHEILLDVVAASLCHTDVRAAEGTFFVKPPMILGHEAAGYVRAIGDGVTYVRPGDAVGTAFASCNQCRRCMSGKQPYCDLVQEMNFSGTRVGGEVVAVSYTHLTLPTKRIV